MSLHVFLKTDRICGLSGPMKMDGWKNKLRRGDQQLSRDISKHILSFAGFSIALLFSPTIEREN